MMSEGQWDFVTAACVAAFRECQLNGDPRHSLARLRTASTQLYLDGFGESWMLVQHILTTAHLGMNAGVFLGIREGIRT